MPACQINQNIGNCYTGSVFSSLLSVISTQVKKPDEITCFYSLKESILNFSIYFNLSLPISPHYLFCINSTSSSLLLHPLNSFIIDGEVSTASSFVRSLHHNSAQLDPWSYSPSFTSIFLSTG